jgi:hypothetical protein
MCVAVEDCMKPLFLVITGHVVVILIVVVIILE